MRLTNRIAGSRPSTLDSREELLRLVPEGVLLRAVVLAARRGEGLELFALLGVQLCRDLDDDARHEIAAILGIQYGHAAIAQTESRAALRARRNTQRGRSI